ncbi:MAG: hypothetical protein GXP31_05200 [Kiritimatiellaeota bacterium]|nr:hypothetical protein [Kiritimatiellota bacterium]
MKKLLQRACTNWEKTFFWAMVLILLGLGVNWLLGLFGGGEGSVQATKHRDRVTSLINMETAFAFKQELPPPHMNQHPFFFVLKVPEARKPTKPWKKRPRLKTTKTGKRGGIPNPFAKKPGTGKKPRPAAKKPAAKTAKAVAPKPKPKPKPKVVRIVQYQGCITTGSGKRLALVRELKTNKLQYLLPGDKLGEFSVKDFDSKTLVVTDPQGRVFRIAFSQQKKILLP